MGKEIKKAKPDKPSFEINVMMMGGRRCGKTSVLASMQSCFNEAVKDTPLRFVTADGSTLTELSSKLDEIQRYFTLKRDKPTFTPDKTPTQELMTYSFLVGLNNSKSKIKINFIDFPGEWINNSKTYEDQIEEIVEKSRILIIAIDTPHLMEEKGSYNKRMNCCYEITEMIKRTGFADADKGAGLILLVPLKCERYYDDKRMEEVLKKVEDAYHDLITYINQTGVDKKKSLCQMAVTPIRTIGAAAFEDFERDSNCDIVINPTYQTPEKAIYYFPDNRKDKPEPADCHQPLLYVLDFTLRAAMSVKKHSGGIGDFFEEIYRKLLHIFTGEHKDPFFDLIAGFVVDAIKNWPGADDYLECADVIAEKRKTEGDGYKILRGQ